MTEPLKVQCLDIDKEPLKGLNGTILKVPQAEHTFEGSKLKVQYGTFIKRKSLRHISGVARGGGRGGQAPGRKPWRGRRPSFSAVARYR